MDYDEGCRQHATDRGRFVAVDRTEAALAVAVRPQPGTGPLNRLDKWLQVSRMFRARSKAAAACSAGRVTVNGQQAKAHRRLQVGDRIEFRIREWKRILVVRELREKPLPKAEAPRLYEDLSPPKPEPPRRDVQAVVVPAHRRRGAGRPTKRDRRLIDRLR